MDYTLAYGKNGLTISFDDSMNITGIEPEFHPGAEDPAAVLREALRNPINKPPLRSCVKQDSKVGIIFNDITRATPSPLILSVILDELSFIPKENITLFNSTGTHRKNTEEELRRMIGDEIFSSFRIVQNDCDDIASQCCKGTTAFGHEVWVNRELAECDLIILTGFIEPHFFAGFSGGGKAIMPGMSGRKMIFGNHSAPMIADPRSTWGITGGNPIWEEIQEAAEKAGNLFLVNVTMNNRHEIIHAYCGDLREAHKAGSAEVKKSAMQPVDGPFDIVITTNSGYPLDLNLYQAVKGMSAAAQIVKPGGTIIIAAECSDGIPDNGLFRQMLTEDLTPEEILNKILASEEVLRDQWQGQILAQILMKEDGYIYLSLPDDVVRSCHLKPVHDIPALCKELAPKGSICVMPSGPLTIPYIP